VRLTVDTAAAESHASERGKIKRAELTFLVEKKRRNEKKRAQRRVKTRATPCCARLQWVSGTIHELGM